MRIWVLIFIVLSQIGCSASKKSHDLHLHIVVKGHVVDTSGRPVSDAIAQARLGLDLDGTAVNTGSDGSFVAEARSELWFKGCPSVNASAEGYSEEWVYFDCWDKGERQFERTIVLKAKPRKAEDRN